jgi:hypothetical protein
MLASKYDATLKRMEDLSKESVKTASKIRSEEETKRKEADSM